MCLLLGVQVSEDYAWLLDRWDYLQYLFSRVVLCQGSSSGCTAGSVSLLVGLWMGMVPTRSLEGLQVFTHYYMSDRSFYCCKAVSRALKYSHIWVMYHVSVFNLKKNVISLGYILFIIKQSLLFGTFLNIKGLPHIKKMPLGRLINP